MTTLKGKVFNPLFFNINMQIKLLKSLVEELAGQESSSIVDILFEKRDVNEFLIAKKMNLTINQVRNILYKLSAEGLVSFTRKKDKRKGWYIYFWTLNTEKCLVKVEQTLIQKIQQLNSQLSGREQKRFYVCKSCNIEVSEEVALAHDFSCEECAGIYELADNEPQIKEIKLKIIRTEKDLRMIKDELTIIRAKSEKKKSKAEKKEKGKKKENKMRGKKSKVRNKVKKKNKKLKSKIKRKK